MWHRWLSAPWWQMTGRGPHSAMSQCGQCRIKAFESHWKLTPRWGTPAGFTVGSIPALASPTNTPMLVLGRWYLTPGCCRCAQAATAQPCCWSIAQCRDSSEQDPAASWRGDPVPGRGRARPAPPAWRCSTVASPRVPWAWEEVSEQANHAIPDTQGPQAG